MNIILTKQKINKILNCYKDGFIFPENATYHPETNELGGSLEYIGGPWLKSEATIFNNGEAIIAANQVCYLHEILLILNKNNEDIQKINDNGLDDYIKQLGLFVVKEQTILLDKPILPDDTNRISFSSAITLEKKTRKGDLKIFETYFGDDKHYKVTTVSFKLESDPHGFF